MGWVVGIDEAGRGSLVGELIVAAFAVPEGMEGELVRAGARDSKQLTPAQRERVYARITSMGVFAVWPVRPQEIDRENVNRLEERAAMVDLRIVGSRVGGLANVSVVQIDRFGELRELPGWLRSQGFSGRLVVEPGADAKYPAVSAASIVAKVVRDRRIEVLRRMYGLEGSGYPSDPRTVGWVRRVLASGARPPIIRYSWGTLRGTEFYVEKAKRPRRTLEDFME